MVHLFKAVVNIGLLLPIYTVPADFCSMMCGLIVLTQWSLPQLILWYSWFSAFVCVSRSVRVQPCGLAFRAGQERALMWRICNWSPLPWQWCHHDRDGQLRPDRRQNLRRWPVPDGERQLLPPWCLQDYITKVKRWGEILFHKHDQELGRKSMARLFFFLSFSPL